MRSLIALTYFTLVVSSTLAASLKPLAEVADPIAKNLPSRCIFTGELRDSQTTYHLAGKGIPSLAPESHLSEIGSINAITPEAAREYIGVFEFDPNGCFTVIARGDHLWARLTGQPTLPIFETTLDHFEYDVAPTSIEINSNPNG